MKRSDPLPGGIVLRAAGSARFFFYLNDLLHAGLADARRHAGRLVYRSAGFDGLRYLIGFGPTTVAVVKLFEDTSMDVTIYHNPDCGTSRATLALIRNAGIEPRVVEYLKTPPSRAALADMIARAGLTVRDAIRQKGPRYAEMGLDDPALSADALLDALVREPALINRPFVVTPLGVRLCRPSDIVLDILPPLQ